MSGRGNYVIGTPSNGGITRSLTREHGYKGNAPTWRKSTPVGDWAVVNVQSSSFSSADRLRCVVNLAVAPALWLDWQRERLGAGMPKTIGDSLGLFRDRLHPTGTPERTDGWWEVTDARSAERAAHDMVTQLVDGGWPVLDRLLDRAALLERVRAGDLGHMKRESLGVFFARAEALLLIEGGPSPELDECLRYAKSNVMPGQEDNAATFDAWVRTRLDQRR
jgi:Domain of unknown function (DUF4304)